MRVHLLSKKCDLVILLAYFLVLIPLLFVFNMGAVPGTLLFVAVPGAYLLARHWEIHIHVLLFSFAIGFLTGFPMQMMAEFNSVWTYDPLFPWLALQQIPLEAVGWYVLWTGFVVCTFKVFFDTPSRVKTPEHHLLRKHRKLIFSTGTIVTGTLFLLFAYPDFFVIPHGYVVYTSALLLIPAFIVMAIHPQLLRNTLKAAVFLSLFALLYEVIGLRLEWWQWPGTYLHVVSIAGVGIPIEELVIWIGLSSLCIITEFELIECHGKLQNRS